MVTDPRVDVSVLLGPIRQVPGPHLTALDADAVDVDLSEPKPAPTLSVEWTSSPLRPT